MRIVKKERVDVKKFMEEMKANRTNRSYTSIEARNRQNSEEQQDRNYASKYRPETIDHYRPSNPQQQPRYNFDQVPRYPPPVYAPLPYPPPRTPPMEYAPSQHFTASPPYQQHSSMFNYSQTFNSQVYPPLHQHDSVRYDQQFAAEMSSPGYQQPRGVGSRVTAINQPNQPERTNNQDFTNPLPDSSKPKPLQPEPAKNKQSLEIPNRIIEAKEDMMKTKPLPEPAKKKRKQNKKVETSLEKMQQPIEKRNTVDAEDLNTASISRKFDEILAVERKKIENKVTQESNFKEIMAILNKRLTSVVSKHFTPTVKGKLTNLSQQVNLTEKFDIRDDVFEQEVANFEAEMLETISGIN